MSKTKGLITKKSWEEFRDCGLQWWINMILHTFGWAIVYEFDTDGSLMNVYPARTKFRGFGVKQNTDGYQKVTQFMKKDVDELLNEAWDSGLE